MPTEETCTAIIVSQAMAFGALTYLDRTITLWPAGARAAAEASGAAMVDIVDVVIARVEAEMPDTDLVCSFAVFDLRVWQRIRRARHNPRKRAKVEEAARVQSMRAKRLARAFALVVDVDWTAHALCAAAEELAAACPGPVGMADVAGSDDDGDRTDDNRRRWGISLARGSCHGEVPQLVY